MFSVCGHTHIHEDTNNMCAEHLGKHFETQENISVHKYNTRVAEYLYTRTYNTHT